MRWGAGESFPSRLAPAVYRLCPPGELAVSGESSSALPRAEPGRPCSLRRVRRIGKAERTEKADRADKPRRPKFEPWELEARDATERLRQVLAQLLGLERAFHAASVEDEELLERLRGVNATAGSVRGWWQEWQTQTAALRSSRAVALSVFRACLPAVSDAVDLYSQSLVLFAISPDLYAGDGDLASRGVAVAKDVSLFALQLLDDTPALRSIDRAAVDATLEGLDSRSKPMLDLIEPIGARVQELRSGGEH